MRDGRPAPLIYELPAATWLAELSRRHGRAVTLGEVPDAEWDELADLGAGWVWLMGVWRRSEAARRHARASEGLAAAGREALADFVMDDLDASPFAVPAYEPEPAFGGTRGLALARRELAARGVRLMLDFVPNHVAADHPWTVERPERLIGGTHDDLERDRGGFFEAGGRVVAHGRDPNFPAWTDTAQVNVFRPVAREAARETLRRIASISDGVRCDMAMLVMREVFARTWGARAGERPPAEYWEELIPAVREAHPGFAFVAEAYWGLEPALLGQGFDACYDKPLYDRLLAADAAGVRAHLEATAAHRAGLVAFVENHDEARAATAFPGAAWRPATLVAATLPGAFLVHHGQLAGARVKLPVQLRRGPAEPVDATRLAFHRRLLREREAPPLREGDWRSCPLRAVDGDAAGCLAWTRRHGSQLRLVLANLRDAAARVVLEPAERPAERLRLADRLGPGVLVVGPDDAVRVEPYAARLFEVTPAGE